MDPRSGARYLFAAALLGALLSQPGHLLAYLARYGTTGLALSSRGVHAYFPGLLALSLALLGAGLLLALAAIASARLGRRRSAGVPFGQLLLVLVLVQVNVYVVQELFEQPAADLVGMLGWGLAGQVPLALVAAAALGLLSSPLLDALAALRSPFTFAARPIPPSLPAAYPTPPSPLQARFQPAPANPRRGPPALR